MLANEVTGVVSLVNTGIRNGVWNVSNNIALAWPMRSMTVSIFCAHSNDGVVMEERNMRTLQLLPIAIERRTLGWFDKDLYNNLTIRMFTSNRLHKPRGSE